MMLEERVGELKAIIADNDGRNAADVRFARAVDDLVSVVYEHIGEIALIPSRALFDLFVIKVLYVGRGSRHADVVDYLGALLESFLYARELYPPGIDGRPRAQHFSDVLRDDEGAAEGQRDEFEAFRRYGDRALFTTGVFRATQQRRKSGGRLYPRRAQGIDRAYYVSTGKAMYRMAARHNDAERKRQRETLDRLADCFEVYVDALEEMSERYLMGFDMRLMADKMLDSMNRYKLSRDEADLQSARRYAALLNVAPADLRPSQGA